MTDELSVIELIMGASFTVKLVMAILVAASVTSWFMIVQRSHYLAARRCGTARF